MNKSFNKAIKTPDFTFGDFWIIRHAQPLIQTGICYGRWDVDAHEDLTKKAALDFAHGLQKYYHGDIPAVILRYSPLKRCAVLAQNLLDNPHLNIIAAQSDARLMEMDFGHWEKKPWADIARTELDAWNDDFAHYCAGGAENVEKMLQRIHNAWLDNAPNTTSAAAGLLRPTSSKAVLGRGQPLCHQRRPITVWVSHMGVAHCLAWLQTQGQTPPAHAAQWQALRPPLDFGQFWLVQ